MKDYIVKLLPTKEKPEKGKPMHSGLSTEMCVDVNYNEGIVKYNDTSDWWAIACFTKMAFFLCTTHDIKEGDEVVVEYTDGYKPIGNFDIGILTRKVDVNDGPYCAIDGKEIDLAGEGHSSNMYKRICEIDSDVTWIKDGMEFSKEEVELTQAWESKRCKELEPGDKASTDIELGPVKEKRGIIKSITRKHPDCWDWEDEVVLSDVKQGIEFFDGEENCKSLPDITTTRGRIKPMPYVVTTCKIKCPTCKQFH